MALQGDAKRESLNMFPSTFGRGVRGESSSQSKRFFGLQNDKNHVIARERSDRRNRKVNKGYYVQNDNNYNEITTQTTFARNDSNCELQAKGLGKNAPQEVTNLFTYSLNNLLTCKRYAFTLAEVLITLAIIGVVAAMTIPTLIQNYQKRVTEVKLKKTYATILQAIERSEMDNGPIGTWTIFKSLGSDEELDFGRTSLEYIVPYLKGAEIKYAYYSSTDAYGSNYVVNLAGQNSGGAPMGMYYAVTSDNMYISFGHVNWNNPYIVIQVDLNGRQGPNVFGKDVFHFGFKRLSNGHKVLEGYNFAKLTRKQILERDCCKTCTGRNYACSAVIMMDNWKISDDYPW